MPKLDGGTTKKAAAKKTTKTTKKAAAKKSTKVASLFPVTDADEETHKEPDAKEGTPEAKEEAEGGEPTSKPRKRKKRPKAAVVRPSIPTAKVFEPDMSLLKPLDEIEDFLRIVLYGDQGVGKTTSLATLADEGKMIIVDGENSVRKRALRKQGIAVDNISLWPDWSYEGLEQLYVTAKDQLEREPGSIFCIGIDTITAATQFWLEDIVKGQLTNPAMVKKHPNRDQFDVFQDDYGVLAEQVKTVITRKLFTLPCHVVVLAHNRRGENEEGAVRVGPAVSPAVQQALLTYADWVLRMTREETKTGKEVRKVVTRPRGNVEAKDRFGVLEAEESNMSLLELYDRWRDAD